MPLVAEVHVDLLELGWPAAAAGAGAAATADGGPPSVASESRFAHVLLLRALGEVRQSAPLERNPLGGVRIQLQGSFSFTASFDGSWPAGRLRKLLAGEALRADLLRVPLADEAAWRRPDLGARRVASYRVCPWPWVGAGGLCAMTQVQHRAQPLAAGGSSDTEGPWLRVRLRARIAYEKPWGDGGLDLPKSGDILELPSPLPATHQTDDLAGGGNMRGGLSAPSVPHGRSRSVEASAAHHSGVAPGRIGRPPLAPRRSCSAERQLAWPVG